MYVCVQFVSTVSALQCKRPAYLFTMTSNIAISEIVDL
jgi:hypothetical protein